jgi:epoxyqueuosine reductase
VDLPLTFEHSTSPQPRQTGLIWEDLAQFAQQLGFQQIAILPVAATQLAEPPLQEWLLQGFHADMAWMQQHQEKRLNPALLMPNTQCILIVTANYFNQTAHDAPRKKDQPLTNPQTLPASVKFARYARGTDYHRVLKQLLAWLQTFYPALQGRALTDSAPILEKALAAKAGLGWQGKHSNLIAPGYGSWFFIGELLLTLDLSTLQPKPSNPVPNFCGSCTRCIDVCPTEAIVAPYTVDANKCLAYWTIESKGETLPDAITTQNPGWVFGCDICQEVCPWNLKWETETQIEAFQPRPWALSPLTAQSLLNLDRETYQQWFQHSPVKRVKLVGIQRNANALR